LLHAATMRLASKPGAPPERLWNLVKQEAVVKAPLSSIFGSALLPLLDDDTIDTY